jgi:hypothetical protein
VSLTNHWGQDKEIHEGNKRVCVGGKLVVVRWGLRGGGGRGEAAGVSTDGVNIKDKPASNGVALSWQMIILANSGKMKKLLGEGEGTQRPRDTALGAQKERGREGSQ